MAVGDLDGLVSERPVRGRVVGVGAVVAVNVHGAIAVMGVEHSQWSVDGDLLVVHAETVAVGVGV